MSATTITQTGNTPSRVAITIPANSGNGSTIMELLLAGGYKGPDPIAVKILGTQAGVSTSRGAFVAASTRTGASITGTDFTTHGQYVAAGDTYYTESDQDTLTYVRSASASTVSAVALILK